jgi:CPA2 family monovalent cation:H+ antiporter-2
VGFLLTGILIGPHGLRLIGAVHEVEMLAEIGIVLLLFTIGIEFSFGHLLRIKKSVLLGGSLQVVLTLLAGYYIARYFDQSLGEALFIGFLVALSSTAIVLKLIQDRAEMDSPHGRTAFAILIFQDVIIVAMILFTPLLAGATGNSGKSLLMIAAKGAGIILLVLASAKWLVPQVLYQVARTRSRELFLLSIFAICLAIVWLTASAGLSLALGAFLAGLIISESEYSHQALGNIIPFRDVFTSFFFVSIGMLLNLTFLFQQPGLVVLIAVGVMIFKAFIAGFTTLLLGFPLRTAVFVGFALSQVGEFSFILSKTGIDYGLLSGKSYQLFLTVSVLTMAATPFVMSLSPRLANFLLRLPLPMRLKTGWLVKAGMDEAKGEHLSGHLIIVGFGVNGRNVARAARAAGIPYVIIEMNPETVRKEKSRNEPIYYGDAIHEAVMKQAKIETARVLVVAISDAAATRQITYLARRLNRSIHIIARTRFVSEMAPLHELGADEVIPEEFETSIEIFTRALKKYLVSQKDIETLIAEMRAGDYKLLCKHDLDSVAHKPDGPEPNG